MKTCQVFPENNFAVPTQLYKKFRCIICIHWWLDCFFVRIPFPLQFSISRLGRFHSIIFYSIIFVFSHINPTLTQHTSLFTVLFWRDKNYYRNIIARKKKSKWWNRWVKQIFYFDNFKFCSKMTLGVLFQSYVTRTKWLNIEQNYDALTHLWIMPKCRKKKN